MIKEIYVYNLFFILRIVHCTHGKTLPKQHNLGASTWSNSVYTTIDAESNNNGLE